MNEDNDPFPLLWNQRNASERTSYSIGHRPVDYEKIHYRGDQIRFVTRLARRTPVLRKGGARK